MSNLMRWHIDFWKEGKYLDFWSINHLLFGILCLSITLLFSISLLYGFLFSLLIFILWEISERFFDIFEHLSNKITDVISSIVGFVLGDLIIKNYQLDEGLFLTVIIILFGIFTIWGISSYYIRGHKSSK